MKRAEIEINADKIAEIITDTETELRGNLFLLVSDRLSRNSQNYTSDLLKETAIKYGLQ